MVQTLSRKITLEFGDDFMNGNTLCNLQVKSPEGIIIDEFQMTLDNFISSVTDADIREMMPKKMLGVKKVPKLTFGPIWKIIKKGKKEVQNPYRKFGTAILPKNCVQHIWINRIRKSQIVFVDVPKSQWDITFYNTPLEQVGYPRMLFGYRIIGNKVNTMYILAVKEKGRITKETEIYHFPYANVSNGTVCMGGNQLLKLPDIEDLWQLGTYHNLFFQAPSSACYYNSERNLAGFTDLREFYRHMENRVFSDEYLRKQGTFKEFVKQICKRSF